MGLNHSPRIVTDGLVLCLDAANRKSYSGSGNTWIDLSGNAFNHTLTDASITTIDGALCFNMTGTGRAVDSGTTYTFGASHTMIAWARPLADSSTAIWRTLWRTQPDDHPLLIQNDSNVIGYYDNNAANFVSYGLNAGTLGLENKWTMFTIVATGGVSTCYINAGSVKGSVNYTASGTSHDAIGNVSTGTQPFGYVSLAKLYSRALTIAEIQQNFNALRGRYGI